MMEGIAFKHTIAHVLEFVVLKSPNKGFLYTQPGHPVPLKSAAEKRKKRDYDEQLINDVSQHQDSKSGTN
jgi:hypothetical protein